MKTYQITGIGNAVVDVLNQSSDDFIAQMGIERGIMQLIDRDRGEALYAAMDTRVQAAGGSVANTLAGLGALGLRTAFIGRVADDDLGRFYADSMTRQGTDFVNPPVENADLPTSRSMIFVSPDGERSMNTYLGISTELGPENVPEEVVQDTDYLFLEGYLYDKPKGKAAFEHAAKLCRAAGGQAGIALSDPFCVERHRADFRRLVKDLDFVIGNEYEWSRLYELPLEAALKQATSEAKIIVCTRGNAEVIVQSGAEQVRIPVTPITPIDATGAGDQFAAGFIYGLASGKSLDVAGQMGCIAAAEVIGHVGARPIDDIRARFKSAGL